ncbi:uncharacterized [Tachysurus ichikawai]
MRAVWVTCGVSELLPLSAPSAYSTQRQTTAQLPQYQVGQAREGFYEMGAECCPLLGLSGFTGTRAFNVYQITETQY